ncbi:PIR Superfamily Protein [Plasmodium ovale curtisi]|uniref:PIR Superfamily Protein n=1 Tax=Plasmodium ovale curtisi TaxID=864141 RepID=A0A1A8VRV8_PLAOA|nr:PIR Superfamily Protein [Plasmodium ovale curtisi]SBT02169.1 PIR Superfamily Protein [Plasmodium ovale curtisi]
MECYSLPISDTYRFFNTFDTYKSLANEAKGATVIRKVNDGCKSFLSNSIFTKVPSSDKICKQFIHIYNKLSNTFRYKKNTASLNDNDYSFMNYWINDALSGSSVDSSIYIQKLYEKLKAVDNEFFTVPLMVEKFNNMKFHDLENIKILIDLYNYKDEISNIIIDCHSKGEYELCLYNTITYNEKYNEAIINCDDCSSNFYNALELFKCTYNKEIIDYVNILLRNKLNNFDYLQDYKYVLKEHRKKQFKRILTIPILFPMFGLLLMLFFSNMLTPFRQLLLGEIKKIRDTGIYEYGSKKLLLRSPDGENKNFNYGEYNIGYFSIRDDLIY